MPELGGSPRRRRPLAALLGHRVNSHITEDGGEAQSRIARAYAAARAWVPIRRNCLLDSLALRRFLDREWRSAALVIGIKEAPFGAHCWLQSRTAILNDAYDRASRFTPILVA